MTDTPDHRLWCLVKGDTVPFSVVAQSTATVHTLKELIHEECKNGVLQGVDTNRLILAKVDANLDDFEDDIFNGTYEPLAPVDLTHPWYRIPRVWPTQPPDDHLHIFVTPPLAKPPAIPPDTRASGAVIPIRSPGRWKRVHSTDITSDICGRWTKKARLTLPLINELPGILDQPLQEAEKVPLKLEQHDDFLSNMTYSQDACCSSDVEKVFRISDEGETSLALEHAFTMAILIRPPTYENEATFISFWDYNLRVVLEQLLPSGRSIRGELETVTRKLTPDYGLILDNVCPFRGEERSPTNPKDPKAELSDTFTWVYDPAPYVFGYYATGANVTLVAISAPQAPSQKPFVHDLVSANLDFKRERFTNLRRLINLYPYIAQVARIIGFRRAPEFTRMERDGKFMEIGTNGVTKTYPGHDRSGLIRHIQNIYRQLKEKGVPHPKGIPVAPSNEEEVLDAVVCILQALKVLHQPPSLFHRDIQWQNVVRRADDPKLWFLIDWEEAAGSSNTAAKHLRELNHSPRVFVDNHGGEVDIWGVGFLLEDSVSLARNVSSELVHLGTWMRRDAPSAQEALTAVEEYRKRSTPRP